MDKNKKKHAEEGGSLEQRVYELEEKVERLERNATAVSYEYGEMTLQRLIKLLPQIIKRYSR
ncbi:MAG: hypothetical protein PUB89_13385 [Oscillospiraceae bacterium]|nr:hypothetical protein [Oscillospiraceae bacterium]